MVEELVLEHAGSYFGKPVRLMRVVGDVRVSARAYVGSDELMHKVGDSWFAAGKVPIEHVSHLLELRSTLDTSLAQTAGFAGADWLTAHEFQLYLQHNDQPVQAECSSGDYRMYSYGRLGLRVHVDGQVKAINYTHFYAEQYRVRGITRHDVPVLRERSWRICSKEYAHYYHLQSLATHDGVRYTAPGLDLGALVWVTQADVRRSIRTTLGEWYKTYCSDDRQWRSNRNILRMHAEVLIPGVGWVSATDISSLLIPEDHPTYAVRHVPFGAP